MVKNNLPQPSKLDKLTEVNFLHQPNLYFKKDKALEFIFDELPCDETDVVSKVLKVFPKNTRQKRIVLDNRTIKLENIDRKDRAWAVLFILILRFIEIPVQSAQVGDDKVVLRLPWVKFFPKTTQKILNLLEEATFQYISSEDFESKLEEVKAFYNEQEKVMKIGNNFAKEVHKGPDPYYLVGNKNLFQLGQGANSLRFRAIGRITKFFNYQIVRNKHNFRQIAKKISALVPEGREVISLSESRRAAKEIGYPVVTKPLKLSGGKGVTTNIDNNSQLKKAFKKAKKVARNYQGKIVIEKHLDGKEHRLFYLNGEVKAVVEREPACIVGDGKKTVEELIEEENKKRKDNPFIKAIKVPHNVNKILSKQGYDLTSVPEVDKKVFVRKNSNFSTGGKVIDRTDEVCNSTKKLTERMCDSLGLKMAGVDLITEDIKKPLTSRSGFIEVNSSPGIDPHVTPSKGKGRPVHKMIYHFLASQKEKYNIPTIAIFGFSELAEKTLDFLPDQAGLASGRLSSDGSKLNYQVYSSFYSLLLNKNIKLAVVDIKEDEIRKRGAYLDHIDYLIISEDVKNRSEKKEIVEFLTSLAKKKKVVSKAKINEETQNIRNIIKSLLK